MYDGSSTSHNELNILNASTTTNSVTAVAPLTVSPHDCIGISIAPSATVGIDPEKRTNIFHENRPLRATAACLTPPCTDMPNAGLSTRTSPLSKPTALMTQRTLRYLRREQRREVAEGTSPRWIDPNYVRSPNPGSISYTHRLEEISAQMTPSQRAPQLPTDCHHRYSIRHTHLPRKPPSQTVHPRAAAVTRRTLRYLHRTQRREIEEKKVSV